jgi:hypothetical protein
MQNVHLVRLASVVHTLATGGRLDVPYHAVGRGMEAHSTFVVDKDPSDGVPCVMHRIYTRAIGDLATPMALAEPCQWSIGEMLSYLVELDADLIGRVDACLEMPAMGGSNTLRDLMVLSQQDTGVHETRIAAENLSLHWSDGKPVLESQGPGKWSFNAAVMMVRQGR